ncbi:hypothetical protein SAMN04488243_12218 [Thermus arciformis]|uniref:Uncharacterized protein n=1 Tax=Thermus arciformis TaxID=482827 RepID=A0A1G7HXG3_9DEIN|nr:hypothetical protein [Thermus arciformis]SDF05048.1 hypothetical protein SAMN04488243_12218 [Thermus arciformis]
MGRDIPITVHNLGSPEGKKLDFAREELYRRMDAPMMNLAIRIPVYLVNEAQMDLLYPPERRRFFPEEPLRRRLRELREREPRDDEDPFAPLEDLDRWGEDLWNWNRVKDVVAVGLYLSGSAMGARGKAFREEVLRLGEEKARTEGAEEAFLDHEGPAIFLCPERVVGWAAKRGVRVALVQDKVYYHELGHALMDTADPYPDPYRESWGRVVEESLANLVAWRRFQGKEAAWVARLIREQPPEYRGYAAAALRPFPYYEVLWNPFFREFWEDYLRWSLRRGFPDPFLPSLFPPLPMDLGEWNLLAWREAKRLGLWRRPEVARPWRAFAKGLLEEALGA